MSITDELHKIDITDELYRLVVKKLARHKTWKKMIWAIKKTPPNGVGTRVWLWVVEIDVNPADVAKIYSEKLVRKLFEGTGNGDSKY